MNSAHAERTCSYSDVEHSTWSLDKHGEGSSMKHARHRSKTRKEKRGGTEKRNFALGCSGVGWAD